MSRSARVILVRASRARHGWEVDTVSIVRNATRQHVRRQLISVVVSLIALGIGVWLLRGRTQSRAQTNEGIESQTGVETTRSQMPSVKLVKPRTGGIPRTIQQPATMHAFESVDLYAMVSGYLKTQAVDIGSRIKKGEVLAEINVPRDSKARDESAALVAQAKAQIDQANARVKMAQAQAAATDAAIKVAEADLDRLTALRVFAEKQYARVQGLVAERAADAKLADEQVSELAAAVAAERTGASEILNARAKFLAAEAAIDQAKADATEAGANLGVAEARLERATVNLDYARIIAPFDGVVTHRGFHPGALIRSPDEGSQQPLLAVKRTDKMRVVVLVPDGDVVLTKLGDTAVVGVDALGGRSFTGTLARIARAEDAERMMRVEIDLQNPDDVLFDGMYGKALINLEQDTKNLSVPAACIVQHSGRAGGVVFIVRDGIARRTEVKLGGDNGTLAEIRSGIKPDDMVVLPAGTPLEDGMHVAVSDESRS
jgi:HlyD family secretion protein